MRDQDIINAMNAHAEDFNLTLGTIGQMAAHNRYAYERIVNGTAHRSTRERVLAWMESDRKKREAT